MLYACMLYFLLSNFVDMNGLTSSGIRNHTEKAHRTQRKFLNNFVVTGKKFSAFFSLFR